MVSYVLLELSSKPIKRCSKPFQTIFVQIRILTKSNATFVLRFSSKELGLCFPTDVKLFFHVVSDFLLIRVKFSPIFEAQPIILNGC